MTIGLIVAIELDAIFDYYPDYEELESPAGYDVYRINKGDRVIYAIHTGMGEAASAAGVQYLVTKYGVEMILNFGVVGGLTGDMKKQRVCVVDRVVHYRYDCTEFMPLAIGQVAGHDSIFLPTTPALVERALEICPELTRATCCSGDRFVGAEEDKLSLHREFEGDICDMEAAGIVLTCEANGVPCLMLKAVSDGLADGARGFYEELKDASAVCLRVADTIVEAL